MVLKSESNPWNVPDAVDLETAPCPLGCRPDDSPVVAGRDRLNRLPGKYGVVRCRACGLMRTDPRPTPDTIGYYYPDHYGPYLHTRVAAPDDAHGRTAGWKRLVKRVVRFNTDCLPEMAPGKLLEIGCASGMFLFRMSRLGWQVAGIEISERAASHSRSLGFPVHNGPLETAPDPAEPYDLIAGWMVLEHLHDPVGSLVRMRRWIRKEGWLVFSIPDAGSWEFKIFRSAWYALHLPNHLFHFTPQTIRKVLDRTGWKTARIFHQRTLSNLIGSTGYWMEDRGGMHRLSQNLIHYPERAVISQYLLFPPAWMLSLLGQTGRMTIWAKPVTD
jgi:2-polyprenyl-3-methyl-5-hydroxy-6-metoxy-1,4-benzoquinol methylase